MNNTGVIRKVDQVGRIVIPKHFRDKFDIDFGDDLEIYINDNSLCLKKVVFINEKVHAINKICKIIYEKIGFSCGYYEGYENLTNLEGSKDKNICINKKLSKQLIRVGILNEDYIFDENSELVYLFDSSKKYTVKRVIAMEQGSLVIIDNNDKTILSDNCNSIIESLVQFIS